MIHVLLMLWSDRSFFVESNVFGDYAVSGNGTRFRTERTIGETARSVLRNPLGSVDHMSLQLPELVDASKMKWTLECYSGTKKRYWFTYKVKPDIQNLLLDRTKFPSSLIVQPPNFYKLLETFQSSDAASKRGTRAVGFRSYVDPTKGGFLQYNQTGDHVELIFSVEELKAFLAFCKACGADLHLFLEKAGEPILMAQNLYMDDGSSSNFDVMLVLATKLVSQLQDAVKSIGACTAEEVRSQFQERSRQSSFENPSLLRRVWSQVSDGDSTLLWVDRLIEFLKLTHSGEFSDYTSFLKELEVEHGDAKIGGKKKKQNRQAQSKKDVQAIEKAQAPQQSQSSEEEESVHEIFSRDGTITRDWTLIKGFIIGLVLDQKKDDICWAIVLVRLVQAIYNIGRPIAQQYVFSIDELVDQIKGDEDKSFKLSNLNLALNHIKKHGVMKKPSTSSGSEKAGALGLRVKKDLKLYKDVDAAFVQAKVDRFPVGLSLEVTEEFEYLPKDKIYILPKKREIRPDTRLHMVLVVGYGFTEDGQLFFIIQNSWGTTWSLRGFARIIIQHNCDVIGLDE
ncbi:Papain-like cysteine peptidase superfamily [Arabidopsis suecica]|uniref:Papain-like cysteine peptidase superfamily n=1 Tax=Arabidopsis suecica TaxID=45249 RepID=A0A8T2B6E1_ARASU|nr:Papain-like cysteine peptidase superfamily [Arabidopsis suecica]